MYADTPPELCKETYELAHELKYVGRTYATTSESPIPSGSTVTGGANIVNHLDVMQLRG
jgi:hypothetical protein